MLNENRDGEIANKKHKTTSARGETIPGLKQKQNTAAKHFLERGAIHDILKRKRKCVWFEKFYQVFSLGSTR